MSGRFQERASESAWLPLVCAACLLLRFPQTSRLTQAVGLSLAGLGSAWVLVAALQDGWLKAGLSCRVLAYTGRISYGWYLWHYPILMIGERHLPHFRGLDAVLVGTSYLAAVASYHWVERPFLRLKARFEPTKERTRQQLRALAEHHHVGAADAYLYSDSGTRSLR